MPILMHMSWPGVTAEQYDELLNVVQWETDKPAGGVLHVAAIDENGLHVTDVWDSPEQMNDFVQNRLLPATTAAGVPGQPGVQVFPIHAVALQNLNHLKA